MTRFGAREHLRPKGLFIINLILTSHDVIGQIFLCEVVHDISVGVLGHVW